MAKKKLPDSIPDLIRLALHDLELCEKDERYNIDMSTWHEPLRRGCYVCFAGSVMAKQLNCNPNECIYPSELGDETHRKLNALDYLRRGNVYAAYRKIGRPIPVPLEGSYDIVPYRKNRKRFKLEMYALADLIQIAEIEAATPIIEN